MKRFDSTAAAGVIFAQVSCSITAQSATAGAVVALLLVVFLGPTQWEHKQ